MSDRPTFWLLFPAGSATPSVARVGTMLRAYDVTLSSAQVEGFAGVDELDAEIAVLGHHLRLSHHATRAPEYFVDAAIAFSPLAAGEEARAHVTHLALTHTRGPGTLLEQHLLLVLVAAALTDLGARHVVHPRARTLLPTAAFSREGKTTIEMLMSISNLVLILGVHRQHTPARALLVTRGLDVWGSPEIAIDAGVGEADARTSFKVLEEIAGHVLRTHVTPSAGDRAITSRGAFLFRASTDEERISSDAMLVLAEVHDDLTPIVEPERTA